MKTGRGGKLLFCLALIFTMLGVRPGEMRGQPAKKPGNGSQAEIIFVQGRAESLAKGESAWKPLRVGHLLSAEDEVRTGDQARIEIRLPDRSILRFDQRTTVQLRSLLFESDGSREVKVGVSSGKTWANVRKAFGPKKTFEMASANAVAGVRGTVWRMNVEPDQSTLIRVYEGTVDVYHPFVKSDSKPEEGGFKPPREVPGPQEVPRPYGEVTRDRWEQIVLTQMMQVVIPPTGRPDPPASFLPEEDQREDWVRWNQERDRQIRP